MRRHSLLSPLWRELPSAHWRLRLPQPLYLAFPQVDGDTLPPAICPVCHNLPSPHLHTNVCLYVCMISSCVQYVNKAVPQDKSLSSSSHLKTIFRAKPCKLYLQYSLTRGYLWWYSSVQYLNYLAVIDLNCIVETALCNTDPRLLQLHNSYIYIYILFLQIGCTQKKTKKQDKTIWVLFLSAAGPTVPRGDPHTPVRRLWARQDSRLHV